MKTDPHQVLDSLNALRQCCANGRRNAHHWSDSLHGADLETFENHRIGMMAAIAPYVRRNVMLDRAETVAGYPSFF